MKTPCPKCATPTQISAGDPANCGRCGHWWLPGGLDVDPFRSAAAQPAEPDSMADVATMLARPALATDIPDLRDLIGEALPPTDSAAPAQPIEFELQFAVGDAIQGPYDRITLREMLYTGRLTGDERVRIPGSSSFEKLSRRPEMAGVLALVEKRKAANARPAAPAPRPAEPRPAPAGAAPEPTVRLGEPDLPPAPPKAPERRAPVAQPQSPASKGGPSVGMLIGGAVLLILAGVAVVMIVTSMGG
jgi:hypothetical protein